MVVNVAGNANCRAGILADSPDLTALQANLDVLSSHNLGAVVLGFFILVDYSGRGASTAAKDCAARGSGAHTEYLRPDRNHVHGQAVSAESSLGSKNTRVNSTAHAVQEILRDTRTVAVDDVAGTHALCGNNVCFAACGLFGKERNVSASAGIVLDSFDQMRTGSLAHKVNDSYPLLDTTTAVSNCDSAVDIAAALAMALFRYRQGQKRPTLPEVVIDWAYQMSDTGGYGFVGSEVDGVVGCVFALLGGLCGIATDRLAQLAQP